MKLTCVEGVEIVNYFVDASIFVVMVDAFVLFVLLLRVATDAFPLIGFPSRFAVVGIFVGISFDREPKFLFGGLQKLSARINSFRRFDSAIFGKDHFLFLEKFFLTF
ncbi:hypothetical protein D3C86_1494390 [compost metagenome]